MASEESLQQVRTFYAEMIAANAGVRGNQALTAAFASTPRERFLGPGPWRVVTRAGYVTTPSDNPALLYQDAAVAIDYDRQINNGQPVLHAICLAALDPKQGETAVHIGAGTGYYTALLTKLVGPTGTVYAYELEHDLARRAAANLADMPNVTVCARSASAGTLPDCDLIYISAGATGPLRMWLDALPVGGRLLFPMTPADIGGRPAAGWILLLTKLSAESFAARFVCAAAFIHLAGARDEATAARLTMAFARGGTGKVQSLRLGDRPDATCWCAGDGWWLSTAPPGNPD
jgi:protein-L-isoaspartate(D-aspartate) O-methyltransferase